MRIVESAGVLGGKPHLEGRRIAVLQVAELVLDADEHPEAVADQLDVPLADVHRALSYYYDHVDEMDRLRQRRAALLDELHQTSKAPDVARQ